MLFGLCNTPATLERLMENVLEGIPLERCLVYLDDLMAHRADFYAVVEAQEEVLEWIMAAGLKLYFIIPSLHYPHRACCAEVAPILQGGGPQRPQQV